MNGRKLKVLKLGTTTTKGHYCQCYRDKKDCKARRGGWEDPALRRLRQEDSKFKVSLGYLVSPCQKINRVHGINLKS